MRSGDERRLGNGLRVVLVGTGTEVGKTHVACALLGCWSERVRVAGLKPIETGVGLSQSTRSGDVRSRFAGRAAADKPSDQERLASASRSFHVKRSSRLFHVKHGPREKPKRAQQDSPPLQSLFTFPDPVSPHLAARQADTRIDIGLIDRWVRTHEAPVTVIETAGGLFSPLGHDVTNFELAQALRPHAVILVAADRLGVLHDLTTTLALAAQRGGLPLGVVLSAPAKRDASSGRNEAEIVALGIARPIAVFPRAGTRAPATIDAARLVIAWIERSNGRTLPRRGPA